MVNSKLVTLLKTFSGKEIKRFKEFVHSPYFNKNRNVINLCDAVLSYSPGFSSDDFTEENIYKKIFGSEKFDYYRIKNIISDLFSLAILYLKISGAEKKDTDNEITLLNTLHDRKLDPIYLQREKKIKYSLQNSLIKDEDNYLRSYQLERINTAHYKFDRSEYTFGQIQKEFDTFLDYSLTGLLRLYSKMLHNKNHGNINFNMEMLENVWAYSKDKDFSHNPSCQIYRQIVSLELTRDENEYRKLLSLKQEYSNNLPNEEVYYILLIINSFAAYRLNMGDESYYKDRFLAFKEIIDRDFFPGNIIYPNFITTFTSACMAGEAGWAEDFKKRFQNGILPKEEKYNALCYCNAFLAYRKKQYDKALEYFAKTSFRLYLFKVMVKSYTVRIYYEQDMYEQAISAIDAFRHYLKTEKLMADSQKTSHYEFLNHVNALIKLKLEGGSKKDEAEIAMLRKQINEMPGNPIGIKNWLIEKVEEIKKGAN